MRIFDHTNIDFLKWRWHAIALSWVIIIAGAVTFWTKGIPLGVEFAGGTVVIAQFDQPVSIQQVRGALDRSFPGGGQNLVVQEYGTPAQHQVMVRVPTVGTESGAELGSARNIVEEALKAANLPSPTIVGTEIVGATVGRDLTTKGISATVLSLIGILAYLAFRFQFSFGVGAVVATIHDLLITLAFLAFFRYDMSLNVIAAVLTMTGFSTNDTIVIFDRVRENEHHRRHPDLRTTLNRSINETLPRTVLTHGTTLATMLSLAIFGGEVIRPFALVMFFGVFTGIFSSMFIAPAVLLYIRERWPLSAAVAPKQHRAPATGRGAAAGARE